MALFFEDVFLRVVAINAELVGHSSIFVVFLLMIRCSMDGLHVKINIIMYTGQLGANTE